MVCSLLNAIFLIFRHQKFFILTADQPTFKTILHYEILKRNIFKFVLITAPNMASAKSYDIVLKETSLEKIIAYKMSLITKTDEAGAYLKNVIEKRKIVLDQISNEQFIELPLLTKKPLIFAESDVQFDGSDWTEKEMELLGDLNIAMNVDIYDNGVWLPSDPNFRVHNPPLNGTLLFTPGPLLQRSIPRSTPDLKEIQTIDSDTIDQNYLLSDRPKNNTSVLLC